MQNLNFEQIKQLVHGVAFLEEGDGKISFFRFNNEQQELYKNTCADFHFKTFATSCVTLEFETDSQKLLLEVVLNPASSRTFFTHSIFVNGEKFDELSGNIGNDKNVEFSKEFSLPSGTKIVKILFPWSVASSLVSLGLDDNATINPVNKTFNILMFGDSITQGYDAIIPENSYAFQLTTKLNAEVRNKGIAAEQFFSKLSAVKEEFDPELITVAYGTNDWRHGTREKFERECESFFVNLRENYPNTKIVAITPLWRVDIENEQNSGMTLSYVSEYIKNVCSKISNAIVIEGNELIPHDPSYFQTDGVHPIDKGFISYGKNLINQFEKLEILNL